MATGEVCRRREGEMAEENETRRVKRKKLEEEEVDAESSVVEEECHQVPNSECDLLDRVSSSSVSCCSSNNRPEEMEEVESLRRRKKKNCEMVKEAELEGFFLAAEKDVKNKMWECSSKYNFDFEKDEPLGGRYEWLKFNS
ncbi:unnamed protein product [Eruca vesicaria subsp. sativa]|uniref:Cyclin-dependent kinase inhibitor domain-containing protein n=1 Tax=Eruca vesicaria subsp. sativa TaxID=29727 RepID=A0ABC8JHE9_ERUVS|nr:unnamed protein product [Eruca vesicaria subsp. sativa]